MPMESIYCPWEPASFLFISSNVPLLIHYSHYIAIFAAAAIALLIFASNPKSAISRLFLLFFSLFITWALLDVILWATNDPAVVMFSWAMQVLLEPATYAVAFLLFYNYLHGNLPPFRQNVLVFIILLPLIFFLPTTLNLGELYLSYCETAEGPLAQYYTYIANFAFIILIIYQAKKYIPTLNAEKKRSAKLFVIGLVTFLITFTSGNVISSFTDDWTLSQYGLFGMPIFAFLMAYSIVRYSAFRVQVTGAQVIVVFLWALVGSLLVVEAEILTTVVFITLIFTTVAGYLLIVSVRREIEQREEIEQLAKKLSKANKRLKILDKMKSEFVSIASHQLRSPLTSIRGYASMLLEGSYGKLPKKATEAIERIQESSRYMALSVEDYLNVSRIEAGNMKYELSDFNLKDVTEKIVDEIRPAALKKGLLLVFRSDCDGSGYVHADIGKVHQVIHNLIDNAMKYTPKGSITVVAHDNVRKKKMYVSVIDTGVGMSKETIDDVFDKFIRAKNANEVNVTGTGLGLFVARKMVNEMGGKIVAESKGEEEGSKFTIELSLVKGNTRP